MFRRGTRALEQQNTPQLPPIPLTRPPSSTPPFMKIFGRKLTQAEKDAAKARAKELVRNALSLLQTTAKLAADAVGDAAVPGLSIGLQALATVLEKVEAMGDTVEGLETLCMRVTELEAAIKKLVAHPHGLPNGMQERIDDLVRTWNDIGERAKKIKVRGRIARFISSDADAKALEGLVKEINSSIQDKIMTQGVLNIEIAVAEVHVNVEEVRINVQEVHGDVQEALHSIDAVHKSVTAIATALDDSFMPSFAKKARHDASEVRRSCLPGTRTAILDHIRGWVVAASKNDAEQPKKVFWICGLAGTGKTTLAHSIAEWAQAEGILGGEFFCSRFDPECSNPDLMFVTLSRQLCQFHAPFKEKAMEALKKNPDLVHSAPTRQFEELIVRPLEALDAPFPLCLIVIDALDECKGKGASSSSTSTVLSIIAKFFSRIEKYLIFVVTSRPEPGITALFQKPLTETLQGVTTSIELHMIERESTKKDIRQCLVEGLKEVPKTFEVPQGWPLERDVDRLVVLADGLFVFVKTAIAFIMDEEHCDPPARMQCLTDVGTNTGPSGIVLHELYAQVIEASHAKMAPELVDRLQKVLGTIALAQVPFSVSALSGLLGLSEDAVRNTLRGLHSVLHVPNNRVDPILVIHPTFPEFLLRSPAPTTPGTSTALEAFCIKASRRHWFLLSQCLEAMSALKRDIIGIRYPAKLKDEIDDFSRKVDSAIPPHLRYAIQYWTFHLREGLGDPDHPESADISDRLHGFVLRYLLFWLEVCLLQNVSPTPALNAASSACRTLGGVFADLVPLLDDCHQFIQAHLQIMHAAPLQLYHFALSVAPTNSCFKALYSHELEHSVIVLRGAPLHRTPCLDTVVAHGGKQVYSVSFSADGNCFASGGQDHSLRIWDTATRTELRSFDGHTGWVNCVAFSPDGAYVASGSGDKTACIWQVSTGNRVHTLRHTDRVYSVAYSADGSRILSATDGGEVNLWDTADGRCVFTLEQSGTWIWQAALSLDGNVIARGEKAALALHDVSSATHETLDLPNEVQACAFSPDCHYVAARTAHAIRVWVTADKALVRSIDVPDSTLMSPLAFSRDGKYIACGSESGAVYVWQVASEDLPHTLNGHTDWVQDVAWTPDGLQLASASDDGTVRLWDRVLHPAIIDVSATSEHQPVPHDAAGPPRFALVRHKGASALLDLPSLAVEHFPVDPRLPEGAPVVAALTDIVAACDTACKHDDNLSPSAGNWAFLTGQQSVKLGWRPVSISRGGSLMAYLSPTSDKSVDVCNLHTGAVVATLQGHTRDVRSVVFSPDGTRLATGSEDNTVKVWDATTGVPICSHVKHKSYVRATAFSTDGCLVASGAGDWTMCIFEIVTERVVHVPGTANYWFTQVTFTMDNHHIIALDDLDEVFIWEAASGARVHSFSFRDEGWRRSLTFSSNTLGIRVHGDAGDSTISLRSATIWAVNFYESDGWLYAWLLGATHRLCGLPAEWRDVMGSYGDVVCLREAKSGAHPRGRTIVLDMSRILAYVESLGPDNL